MRKYRLIAKKGEGTFSEVLKAQNIKDNKYHAIKCMKNHFDSIDQVNNLREIQALRRLSPHPHIVKLEEVLYDQPSGRLALVFELMDANLYELIRGRRHYLKSELIRSLMYQLIKSLDHMHNKGIFHRDIKPENILVENATDLKLADFGSCRGIYSKQPYTEYISTRWYRAPECLLTDGYYGPEMDLWGVGCVFFEITSLYPLFPGSNELDQIHRIHKILGTPSATVVELFKRKGAAHLDFNFTPEDGTSLSKLIPHASVDAVDLMTKMLMYDPSKRISSRDALAHNYFRECREKDLTEMASTKVAASNPATHHQSSKDKISASPHRPLPSLSMQQQQQQQQQQPSYQYQSPLKTKQSTSYHQPQAQYSTQGHTQQQPHSYGKVPHQHSQLYHSHKKDNKLPHLAGAGGPSSHTNSKPMTKKRVPKHYGGISSNSSMQAQKIRNGYRSTNYSSSNYPDQYGNASSSSFGQSGSMTIKSISNKKKSSSMIKSTYGGTTTGYGGGYGATNAYSNKGYGRAGYGKYRSHRK